MIDLISIKHNLKNVSEQYLQCDYGIWDFSN